VPGIIVLASGTGLLLTALAPALSIIGHVSRFR
jgi:hypothetical protein